jgi:hypothetical protein
VSVVFGLAEWVQPVATINNTNNNTAIFFMLESLSILNSEF